MLYNVKAIVNYPEAQEIETPDFDNQSLDGIDTFIRRLLITEPDATSFLVVIAPVKGK